MIDETEDALILDVEPIGFDGQIKLDDMSLYMCIERPVRENCKALSDKGIMTLISSANANDVKTRYTKIGCIDIYVVMDTLILGMAMLG